MKILEYRYKLRMTTLSNNAVTEMSLDEFIENYGWSLSYGEEIEGYKAEVINRDSKKVVYSDTIKDGSSGPLNYVLRKLMNGVPEEKAIPRKTLANIGEILKSKKL